MADTSLDDFFAKKDKSRKSKTMKFTSTSEQMAKKPEDGKKPTQQQQQQQQQQQNLEKTTKREKEKVINTSTSTGSSTIQSSEKADDEWKEFEVEEEKDYSGLKIQNLQIGDLRDEDLERERLDDQSEDSEYHRNKEGYGPWNKVTSVATPPVQQIDVPVVFEKPEEKKTEGKKYVAPGMRQDRTATSSSGFSQRSKVKSAPKLDSEEHFPSLSAATDLKGPRKGAISPDNTFEAVKRGPRNTTDDAMNQSTQLSLGNKFDALSQGNES